jgi:hypothetical protein
LSSGGKIVAPRFETFATISALSGQISFASFCPLSDNSGQRGSLALGGFVAF